jgi:hypothetical protein
MCAVYGYNHLNSVVYELMQTALLKALNPCHFIL